MATNFVQASYNEVYDLNTQAGDVTTLKFHAPQGILPQKYLKGFWTQYKQYRYYGSKIMMIPVATLPADPLQISYAAGEPTIDPRDMVNPILHKIYRGEALVDDFAAAENGLYSGVDQQIYNSGTDPSLGENQYYATLQDPSWKKSHVQKGFRAKGIPLVRKLAANTQIDASRHFGVGVPTPNPMDWDPTLGVNAKGAIGGIATDATGCLGGPIDPRYNTTDNNYDVAPDFFDMPEVFTSGWDKLGWLDTSQRTYEPFSPGERTLDVADVSSGSGSTSFKQRELLTRLPKIFTYIAILPPSYKQEMYFRLVISHSFGFKNFRSANMPWDGSADMNTTTTPMVEPGVAPTAVAKASLSVETSSGEVKLTSVGVN